MPKRKPQPELPELPEVPLVGLINTCIMHTMVALRGHALPLPRLAVREDEAAELLGVDVEALRNDRQEARRGGKLKFPYCRCGSRILYRYNDIKAALDALPPGEGVAA